MQEALGLGAIGGKDSMSGTFNDIHVPPTLVSFAIAPGKASEAVSQELKKKGTCWFSSVCPRIRKVCRIWTYSRSTPISSIRK